MGRFLIAFLMLIGFMVGTARADIADVIQKIPNLKQGVAYSVIDSKINYLATIDIINWKGVNLEIGTASDAEKTGIKAVAVISYDLLKLKDVVNIPVLDLIEFRPGIWAGTGRIEGIDNWKIVGEGDYGISLSFVAIKF